MSLPTASKKIPETGADPARRWSLAAVAGPVLLTLAWLILGWIVPPTATEFGVQGGTVGTITSPISGLGVGPHAVLFNSAFILSGLITIVGVFAVFRTRTLAGYGSRRRRNWSAALLSLSPLGFVVAGSFTIEDADTPHFIGFLLVVATPLLSFAVAGRFFRQVPGWQWLGSGMLAAIGVTAALIAFFFATFNPETIAGGEGIAGIPSRLLALEIGVWYVLMGWMAWRGHGQQRQAPHKTAAGTR